MIELCFFFSLDQWELKIHLLWGKCFNNTHWSEASRPMQDSNTLKSFLIPRQELTKPCLMTYCPCLLVSLFWNDERIVQIAFLTPQTPHPHPSPLQTIFCWETSCKCTKRRGEGQKSCQKKSSSNGLVTKGPCHLRFSGIRPLRGYPPPPPPLNGKSVWKKEGFFP